MRDRDVVLVPARCEPDQVSQANAERTILRSIVIGEASSRLQERISERLESMTTEELIAFLQAEHLPDLAKKLVE